MIKKCILKPYKLSTDYFLHDLWKCSPCSCFWRHPQTVIIDHKWFCVTWLNGSKEKKENRRCDEILLKPLPELSTSCLLSNSVHLEWERQYINSGRQWNRRGNSWLFDETTAGADCLSKDAIALFWISHEFHANSVRGLEPSQFRWRSVGVGCRLNELFGINFKTVAFSSREYYGIPLHWHVPCE